jgi:glycosyltransferase involved in cell wall biosynthesis
MQPTIALSINSAWNIVNFRAGLIRRLQEAGYRVVAIAPSDDAVERLNAMGVRHVPIAMDAMGSSPLRDALLLVEYWRILRRMRPAAFLGWTVKPNVYGSLAAQALGIPVINNVSGLGTAFIRRTLLTSIVSQLYRLAFRRSATVFFQNDEDQQLFLAERLAPAGRTALLPGSGIDLARFAPALEERGEDAPFTFLLVARLLRDKGIVEYVEAARMVRTAGRAVRFQLLGFLDVANRSAVSRAEVEAWQAEGVIEYLGHADDVRPFLHTADCVVLPSYREGMPRTLLEAAALAKPLIATDVPGCREIARAGRNAIMAKVADARSLADAMLAMLDLPPERRRELGRQGRRIAEEEFDERFVADRYLDALRRAL